MYYKQSVSSELPRRMRRSVNPAEEVVVRYPPLDLWGQYSCPTQNLNRVVILLVNYKLSLALEYVQTSETVGDWLVGLLPKSHQRRLSQSARSPDRLRQTNSSCITLLPILLQVCTLEVPTVQDTDLFMYFRNQIWAASGLTHVRHVKQPRRLPVMHILSTKCLNGNIIPFYSTKSSNRVVWHNPRRNWQHSAKLASVVTGDWCDDDMTSFHQDGLPLGNNSTDAKVIYAKSLALHTLNIHILRGTASCARVCDNLMFAF